MSSPADQQFLESLKTDPGQRSEQDLDVIYAYLHGMEALSTLREPALRSLCNSVRYEFHDANDILYCQGELATCWYILLSGSVFIEGSMFLPRSSFGKRMQGCARRTSECLTLEPSDMIAIDYPDIQVMKSGPRLPCSRGNLERLLALDTQQDICIRRMNSDSIIDQRSSDIPGLPPLYHGDQYIRNEQLFKRCSRASDTSSAYSGSDMMQSSIDDQDVADMDYTGLVESFVDSDEEEGYAESTESLPLRDTVRECLEKDLSERTEDDIETLLDFMQHFRAFANMTLATRRALTAVMVFAVVEKAGTVVMKDGEELDSWSVILNGEVEITRQSGASERLIMGDSFGITPTMEKLYHHGVMRTLVDDCQFVCIAQHDYYRILSQGEENTKRHKEEGQVVMVTEHRDLDGGNRRGHILIRGTPERLMLHLVEDHSAIDPTYVEDFLLTYRTFLDSPLILANKLLEWFEQPGQRSKVTRVVLLWVNNHFNDFEMDAAMCEFLEHFEEMLEREPEGVNERLMGEMRLMNIACAAKARVRTITLTRATREEILHFQILGGLERGSGIFITKVENRSKAFDAGLKRGDQILEVNGQNFQHISHNRALEILRGATHLSIMVKSNLHDFKEMLLSAEKGAPRKMKSQDFIQPPPLLKQRLSAPNLEGQIPVICKDKKLEKKDKGFMMFGNKPRLKKALMKMNLIPKNLNNSEGNNMNHSDESLYTKPSRKSSTSSTSSSNAGLSNHLSASNPDLTSLGGVSVNDLNFDFPDHVIKVYKADQSFKYLPIHKETTAKEVVMLALQEFGITDPSCNYSLCEVTVQNEKVIKQKRLPDQLQNLQERLTLNGRYYLKNNLTTDTLVPDELMGELLKESQISMLQLNSGEVASQLTLEDFKAFRDMEPTEYIDDLFNLNSKFGCPNQKKFAELVNREMFWVVTEICSETSLVKRSKLLKHFIKIAKHCKDCKNFNSLFAILSGLGHRSVTRLHNTWDRLPSKYVKMFEDLQSLMDPSRNMAKYRSLINSEHIQPPMLPFFPLIKKDLTFIHLGNDSIVDGLINFEKLRMIAKEIRHICNMSSARYDVSNMFLGTGGIFSSSVVSGVATLKRTKNRRASTLPNLKKMYEEAQMVRRVKSYLQNMQVTTDEEKLKDMSHRCEQPARRRDPSPNVNTGSPSHKIDENKLLQSGPKFGSESPGAVRKIMALTDKVRPHNPKIPVPPVTSPISGRRGQTSPRHGARPHHMVHLSPESSSVISLSNMHTYKPIRTASMGSTDSASPTCSTKSYQQQSSSETDSGHCFDSQSSSSVGSYNSPPELRKTGLQAADKAMMPMFLPTVHNSFQHHSSSLSLVRGRPCLPSYHAVMQNASMSAPTGLCHVHPSGYMNPRPPLPDYQAATQMAQLARQKQLWKMDHSQPNEAYYPKGNFIPQEGEDVDQEQVSAV
ncbi:rap guanine nucleotide exchange factor 6-like isoform X3 [Gigantopelta aegis]|uniref:rap guanine nucleotide exchange factor 6-like isoform X3 n=1 Tax=Gigantopelta aegis TaxID=1735272 RepID=UPI001B88C2DF|nr:rap guanine nucleotide exchange factor 6-like isoform X3 [Gigantopelta aegis]